MLNLAINDTIVAVASPDSPAALGIVRLSGDQAHAIARELLTAADPPSRCPCLKRSRLVIGGYELPCDALWFLAPRSYTGQDMVELHMPGSAFLMEEVLNACLRHGARRAGPGEFTARAYVHGKLDARGVEAVLELIHASDEQSARSAARALTGTARGEQDSFVAELLDLVALIEAGIDFVDEEDVSFITPAEALERIERLSARLAQLSRVRGEQDRRSAWPHVVLAGLPNAGKSTLFNALLGRNRALVSDHPGATRDVLTAECALNGFPFILQDAAGLGWEPGDIDAMAAERSRAAIREADLVIWVHAANMPWSAVELTLAKDVTQGRLCLLVSSKSDLSPVPNTPPPFLGQATPCSAVGKTKYLDHLVNEITTHLGRLAGERRPALDVDTAAAQAALERAIGLLKTSEGRLWSPELLSAELTAAISGLRGADPLPEVILGRIFGRFCIGK